MVYLAIKETLLPDRRVFWLQKNEKGQLGVPKAL
jgi:hypothetical protein